MMIVSKAELQQVGIFFAINFLPWDFLLIKKLEIKKTKTTFIISVLKVVYYDYVVLVFSISNFFINKKSQGRKLRVKKIPTCCNSALGGLVCQCVS